MRITDTNKIEQVELATIASVVENGFGGTSVAHIAKCAEVSKGYLYRFYDNKQELVQTLLTRFVNTIIKPIEEGLNQNIPVDLIMTSMIDYTFKIAKRSPNNIKFIYVLLHDYNFQLEDELKSKIKTVIEHFYHQGVEQGLVHKSVTSEEIFTVAVVYPIDFINLRFKQLFHSAEWNDDDIDRVSTFCINTLKN